MVKDMQDRDTERRHAGTTPGGRGSITDTIKLLRWGKHCVDQVH